MAQQMVNGSHHAGSITLTKRMSARYAVIGAPLNGKHVKPQDKASLAMRKERWEHRNEKLLGKEYLKRYWK